VRGFLSVITEWEKICGQFRIAIRFSSDDLVRASIRRVQAIKRFQEGFTGK